MSNKKVLHLFELIDVCNAIQKRLISCGRSKHHDYVIINIFSLVTEYPAISIWQLMDAYGQLMNSSCGIHGTIIPLGQYSFTAKSLY